MEDTLLTVSGKVKCEDLANETDEMMTPALESIVVKDYLVTISGQSLF